MNIIHFDSEQCVRIRRQLDAYLNNELLVETTSEVLRHLEKCEACSRELASRMRIREALHRAVSGRPVPGSLRAQVQHRLRESQRGLFRQETAARWAVALAGIAVVLVGVFAAVEGLKIRRGERLVASILNLGVSDHLECAIKGHNYPKTANPPDLIRKKLGPQYAALLQVVQEKLSGFEVLEGHICSIPGSNRKYVHFITRGQGTIVSVILTGRDGASLPRGKFLVSAYSSGISLYEDHLGGMDVAGFESQEYFGFVVSDLNQNQLLQLARSLAPALNDTLREIPGIRASEALVVLRPSPA